MQHKAQTTKSTAPVETSENRAKSETVTVYHHDNDTQSWEDELIKYRNETGHYDK